MIKLNKIEKNWKTQSRTLGSNMSLECVVSAVQGQGQTPTANDLNKTKQKV